MAESLELKSLLAQLVGQLPPELIAQLELPSQQDTEKQFTAGVTESFFDDAATVPTQDVQGAANFITAQTQDNVETKKQKDARLEAEAESARKALEANEATSSAPPIRRQYGRGY